jgi:hypothetical protein
MPELDVFLGINTEPIPETFSIRQLGRDASHLETSSAFRDAGKFRVLLDTIAAAKPATISCILSGGGGTSPIAFHQLAELYASRKEIESITVGAEIKTQVETIPFYELIMYDVTIAQMRAMSGAGGVKDYSVILQGERAETKDILLSY